jgi:chitodextrinase
MAAVLTAGLVALAPTALGGAARAASGPQTVTYAGDFASVFPNPDRGFHNRYEIINDANVNDYVTANSPAGFNPDEVDRTFARAKAAGDTLIHSYVHLDKYTTTALPQELLDNLSTGLAAIRASGEKIVLRFAYTWDSYPNVTETVIEQHMAQLAPVLAANADVIDHFEAGFLGMWGEWHDSAYTDPFSQAEAATRYRVLLTELDDFPANIPIAVRYPIFNYEFQTMASSPPSGCTLPNNCTPTQAQLDRLGFHDDCFLSDSADMGTYDQNSWLGWFDVPTKRSWVAAMRASSGGDKIVGGETCDSAGDDDAAGVNAQYELSTQHWSEINEDYAPVNINIWKAANLSASGNDPAETLFTRVQRKLGYRLRLVDATFPTSVTPGSSMSFSADLANDGYAGVIQQRPVYLVFDNGTHRYNVPLTGLDLRTWLPGAVSVPTQTVTLPAMTSGSYTLALWLPDASQNLDSNPAYSIRLADTGTWNPTAGYNVLATGVTVGTCSGDCVAPTAPRLTLAGQAASSVSLSWSGATDNVGVTGYDVFRNGTKVGSATGTSYTDSGLTPGTYSYTVTAHDAAGNVSPSSNAVSATLGCPGDCTAPSAPTRLASPSQTTTSVALSWTASTDNVGVTGYDVLRGGAKVGSVAGTSYTDTGLTASTSYTYTVTAHDAAGNVSPASSPLTVSTQSTVAGLVVDNFDGTPPYTSAVNDLGTWIGANSFLNGGGSGVESTGSLALQYNNAGWFGCDVDTDVSTHTYLVLRLAGAKGGEQNDFQLSIGGVTKVFKDFTLDGGAHPQITTGFTDIRIPLAANGISATSPGQLSMGFWYGGASTLSIAGISFQ